MRLAAKIEALLAEAPESDRKIIERERAEIARPEGDEQLAELRVAQDTERRDRLRAAREDRLSKFDEQIPAMLEGWEWERSAKAKAAEPRPVVVEGLEAIEHLDHATYAPKKTDPAPLDSGRTIAAALGKPCRVAGLGTVDP